MLLVTTSKRKTLMRNYHIMTVVETKSLGAGNYSRDDARNYSWQQWTGQYSCGKKLLTPFALLSRRPALFACDQFGSLYCWRWQDDTGLVLNNYRAHASGVDRMALDSGERRLFTISGEDSVFCLWSVDVLGDGSAAKHCVEELYKNGIKETSDAINRELKYVYNSHKTAVKDTFQYRGDPLVLIKGSRDRQLNSNFLSEEEKRWNPKAVAGSLVLERVFGIQCGSRRSTLRYYYSPGKESPSPKLDTKSASRLPSDELEKVTGEQSPGRRLAKCIGYYTSRYVVLEDPQENAQAIYEAHAARVTCMAIHPCGTILASGECSAKYSDNYVHVWNSISCEAVVVLATAHETGVSLLDFSFDGSLLLTLGSGKQSLQVFNWEQEREVAFRHLNIGPIFDIRFEPQSSVGVIAIGLECIIRIALSSGSLSIVNIISVLGSPTQKRIFLCIDFMQQPTTFANTITAFIGSSLGDVGVLIDSKFSLIPNVTHDGSINVLKLSRILMKPFCMVTGGDDDNIKVWDCNMACVATIPVHGFELYREFERTGAGGGTELGGVQSLDLCSVEEDTPFLLVGMRNGDVLEMIVQFKGEEDKSVSRGKVKVSLEAVMVMGEHSSQAIQEDERKLSICLHPALPILVSAGYDCTLRFWDMSLNMLLKKESLGKGMKVSAIAFSPTGALLTLGFTNGIVIFYKFNEAGKERTAHYDPSIERVLATKDSKGAVMLIKYSDDGEFVGVSFDAEVSVNSEGKEVRSGQSFVIIYVQCNSSRSPGIKKSKEPYSKFAQIFYPAKHKEIEQNELNESAESHGVFTHMDFSENSDYLQLCYMSTLRARLVDYSSTPAYLLWDLNVRQAVDDLDALKKIRWSQWSIAPAVYARTLGKSLHSLSPEEEVEVLEREEVVLCALRTFDGNEKACAGCRDGDVHLFRCEALFKANEGAEKGGVVLKERMDAAKSYSACCSPIEFIEISSDQDATYIFVSSLSDEVILKYRFERESAKWDLDCLDPKGELDPYSELPSPGRFEMAVKECWIPRARVRELAGRAAPPPHPCDARVDYVFGRRACDRRNNVLCDYMERVIYTAGSMFIMLVDKGKEDAGFGKKQLAFSSTSASAQGEDLAAPEISCVCANRERHVLALGTSEFRAHIHVWDISHSTKVSSIPLPDCSLVYALKFNANTRHLAAIALTKHFRQTISVVDIQEQSIVAFTTLLHALAYKIRDIEFYPESTGRLVTAGIQHLSLWKLDGKRMKARCFDLTMAKYKEAEDEKLAGRELIKKYGAGKLCAPEELNEPLDPAFTGTVYVTFMGVGFMKGYMITIGDDGYIYIWNDERISKRRRGHEDCIACMHIDSNDLLATGGNDGRVAVWALEGHSPLHLDLTQKASFQVPSVAPPTAFLKPISNLGSSILPAGNCVQSVWLGKEFLLVGMRSGAVHAVEARIASDEFKPKQQFDGSFFYKLLSAIDEEVPKSIAYDSHNKRLLCISQRGHLSVWCLETNAVIESKYFDRAALYIYAFRTLSNTLLVFENEVRMLDESYEMVEGFVIGKPLITAAKVCRNEKVIALASCGDKATELEMYDIEGKSQDVRSIKGHKVNIVEIDFTTDGKYMLCQNELGDVYLYDTEGLERIENVEEETKLHWEGLGLTVDPEFTEVSKHYSSANKVCAITRFPSKNVVAIGDQIGSVVLRVNGIVETL